MATRKKAGKKKVGKKKAGKKKRGRTKWKGKLRSRIPLVELREGEEVEIDEPAWKAYARAEGRL